MVGTGFPELARLGNRWHPVRAMEKPPVRITWGTSAVGRRVAALAGVGVLVATVGGMIAMSQVLPMLGVTSPADKQTFIVVFSAGVGVLLAMLAGILVYQLLRRMVVRRLDAVIRAFRNVEAGDLLRRMEETGNDEFTDVSRAFNGLMDRVADLTASALRSDLMVTWAQRELRLKEEVFAKSQELAAVNDQLVQRVRVVSTLLEVADAVSGTLDLDEVLRTVGATLTRSLGLGDFRVLTLADDPTRLTLRHAQGLLPGPSDIEAGGPLAACMQSGQPVSVPDVSAAPEFAPLYSGGTGSMVALPFAVHAGAAGVILLARPDPKPFEDAEIDFLKLVVRYVGLAVTNTRLYRETLKLANEDQLTRLCSRRRFMDLYQQAWDQASHAGGDLAILMIDVDWFKKFNDVHGHLVGDEVLRRIAEAVRSQARPRDIVARFGGEEFIIAAPDTTRDIACLLGERIRAAVEDTRFETADGKAMPIRLTVSVGAAARTAAMAGPADLVREADRCLYLAKARGRNQVHPSVRGGTSSTPAPPAVEAPED
jgi:diguanylate cyclase (GGDEF)-like protein